MKYSVIIHMFEEQSDEIFGEEEDEENGGTPE